MAANWRRLAYHDEVPPQSLFELGMDGALTPAGEYLTAAHVGGLFEVDPDGNCMPSEGSESDAFFALDATDDIQPSA